MIHKLIFYNQKRFLGNIVRGPMSTEINKNFKCAKSFFYEKSYTYHDFKQRCESVRIFVYFGLVFLLSLDLWINPLKSSYWNQFSPYKVVKNFCCFFFKKPDNIFKHNGSTAYDKYIQMIKN
ncbi:conserved protein, unknown function [Hepatocystis sp. ex Piliocolobus tephrosceles]|nr:conserved protein, unknown function [Hepatocystis sp. ex Piliocolobus tephrosceles]